MVGVVHVVFLVQAPLFWFHCVTVTVQAQLLKTLGAGMHSSN